MKKKLPLIIIIILFIAISCVLGYYTYTYRKLYQSYKVQEDAKIQADQQLEQEKLEKEATENERQKYLEENVYDNNIPIALYLLKGNTLVRADETYCNWTRDSILGLFYSLP